MVGGWCLEQAPVASGRPSKDPELSFADFEKAVTLDPDNADIYHHRGQVNLLIDATNKAIVDFTKAVTLQPNFAVAYIQKLYTDYRAASTIGKLISGL